MRKKILTLLSLILLLAGLTGCEYMPELNDIFRREQIEDIGNQGNNNQGNNDKEITIKAITTTKVETKEIITKEITIKAITIKVIIKVEAK